MRENYLDGWRAISVVFVIASHLLVHSTVRSEFSDDWHLGGLGSLGVSIFFVISGYVITQSAKEEHQKFGSVCITSFYVRRIFRILPPLYFYLLVLVVSGRLGIVTTDADSILYAAVFICNVPSISCSWNVAHTWSLGYEQQFYVIFPFVIGYLIRSGQPKALLAVYLGWITLAYTCFLAHLPALGNALSNFSFILVGVIWGLQKAKVEEIIVRLPTKGWALFFLATLFLFCNVPSKTITAVSLIVAPMLIVGMLALSQRTFLRLSLQNKFLKMIGNASYGIYLWQQVVTGPHVGYSWLHYVVMMIGVFAFCIASFFTVENRLIKLGHNCSSYMSKRNVGR